jgi:Domain of unknown function (DUF4436)
MISRTKRLQLGLTVLVMVMYSAVLLRNLHESERRSLQLKEAPLAGDYVGVSIRVVAVDLPKSEITALVSLRLNGDLAKDPVTPMLDLKLFLNGIRGPQEIEFPRGRRINPFEAVFPLEGNVNRYPSDRYGTSIWMMVTKRARSSKPPQTQAEEAEKKKNPPEETASGVLVAAPQESETLPIVSSINASAPGLKFEGQSVERPGKGLEGFKLFVRRADNVIIVSILTMVLMMSLAMSVLLMSFHALTSTERIELLPLSLCVTLLFGLPALRNAQPAVPPLGVLGDYLSFVWAELIVAVSAVILIWTWLLRQRRTKQEG